MKNFYCPKSTKSPWYNRGYLPHFDGKGIFQFVTFRLSDSMPLAMINKLDNKNNIEEIIDQCYGSCLLKNPDVADIIQKAIFSFNLIFYQLLAWVIMPNHVHLLFLQYKTASISLIMQRIKGSTSRTINKGLKQTGQLWQQDYFDTFIRDEEHFCRVKEYIELNPVKAGLCSNPGDWLYSSAYKGNL